MIAIANRSTVMTDAQVSKITAALQVQVDQHFAPIWNIDADLVFVAAKDPAPKDAWLLAILDTSDQASALGYHDLTKTGQPLGKAFAKSDLDNGYQPSVTISHELLELLADPFLGVAEQTGNRFYAREVCDPPEADEFGYRIGDVLVSDFVTPAWFKPAHVHGPYDYRNLIKKPLGLLKGGYLQYLEVGAGSGWKQVTADVAPKAAHRARHGSRRERRIAGHEAWERSDRH